MALEKNPLRKDLPRDGSPGKMSKSEEVDHKQDEKYALQLEVRY